MKAEAKLCLSCINLVLLWPRTRARDRHLRRSFRSWAARASLAGTLSCCTQTPPRCFPATASPAPLSAPPTASPPDWPESADTWWGRPRSRPGISASWRPLRRSLHGPCGPAQGCWGGRGCCTCRRWPAGISQWWGPRRGTPPSHCCCQTCASSLAGLSSGCHRQRHDSCRHRRADTPVKQSSRAMRLPMHLAGRPEAITYSPPAGSGQVRCV